VGLWLAEGDDKTSYEITFTNNCIELVKYFRLTIETLFKEESFNPRIYVYKPTSSWDISLEDFSNCKINYYVDERANKPYLLYRIGSVKLNTLWKQIVQNTLTDTNNDVDILRGFFAGEGNIKYVKHSKVQGYSYTLRIAQGTRLDWLEKIFDRLKLKYKYAPRERNYCIVGRIFWDIFAKNTIPDLHPIKKERFYEVYSKFKEYHYSHNYLKEEVYKKLDKPLTFRDFSEFGRKLTTIQDVLQTLHNEKRIKQFKVHSKTYWIQSTSTIIIISDVKMKYLELLKTSKKTTAELASIFKVNWKSAHKRLLEMQTLGLVSQIKNAWQSTTANKEIIVLS
jgi:hypothetical protein